jgi:tetratricopeptide (TPR) repeat protein
MAQVRLYSNFTSFNRIGNFAEGGNVTFEGVPPGDYIVEVRAPGYADFRDRAEMRTPGSTSYVHVEMQPESAVLPTAPPVGPPLLTPRARKELERALEALRKNDLNEARARLQRAQELAPNHPDVLYLLGILATRTNDFAEARIHLEKATSFDPKHDAAQMALGGLLVEMKDYAAAVPVLEQAASLAPQRWQPRWLLAMTYYHTQRYADAQEKVESALQLPDADDAALRLLLARIFLAQDERERAAGQAQAVLHLHPKSREVAGAQALLAELSESAAAETAAPEPTAPAAPISMRTPEPALPEVRWLPPGVDEVLPEVDPSIPCSLPDVLAGVGRRAVELVRNLERFTATERVEHTEINNRGLARAQHEKTFEYVAFIREIRPGHLAVEELRDGGPSHDAFPTTLISTGLAAFGVRFHPYYVDDLEVRCEGLGRWRGQPAWQLYFRQRDDLEPRFRSYRVQNKRTPIALKGRVWVSVNSYDILRLETELLEPLPAIALEHEQFLIEYQPVHFRERNVELWLPLNAELYIHFRGKRYRHRHSFSDYMLFSVDVGDRVQQLPPPEPDPEPVPDPPTEP